jgi:hypothetical protein
LEQINHPHFVITGLKNDSLQSGKVAPGMEVQFLLKFTPEDQVDYAYNLVCVTEREKFLLPVRAYGSRGDDGSLGNEDSNKFINVQLNRTPGLSGQCFLL